MFLACLRSCHACMPKMILGTFFALFQNPDVLVFWKLDLYSEKFNLFLQYGNVWVRFNLLHLADGRFFIINRRLFFQFSSFVRTPHIYFTRRIIDCTFPIQLSMIPVLLFINLPRMIIYFLRPMLHPACHKILSANCIGMGIILFRRKEMFFPSDNRF